MTAGRQPAAPFTHAHLVTELRKVRARVRHRKAHRGGFESRLLWIFGSPRSGSTWLLKLLAEHAAVMPINEPLIGWYLGPFLSDLPGGDASALDLPTFTLRRVQAYKESQFFAEPFSDIWLPALGRMMRERFYGQMLRQSTTSDVSDLILAIKEPNGSQSADVIMRAVPRARLLFLLRDGRDVVDSDLAANLEGSWVSREFPGLRGVRDSERLSFIVQSAYKWLWRTGVVQETYCGHPGPKLFLRYEELLTHPADILRRVFDWLALDATDRDIGLWIDRNSFGAMTGAVSGPDQFARSATAGLWRENLRSDEQAAVARILGPKLREFGYVD